MKREGCVLLADRCGRPRRRPASRLVWTQRRASRTVQTNVCLFSDAVRASFYSKSILCQDRLGTSIGKAVSKEGRFRPAGNKLTGRFQETLDTHMPYSYWCGNSLIYKPLFAIEPVLVNLCRLV